MHKASALEAVARIGYTARGVVYLLIGFFAFLAATGGGRPVDTKGGLESLLSQPLGGALLVGVAAGLLCFAGWGIVQAFFDADGHGNSLSGLARRTIYAGNAIFYIGLAIWAASLIFALRSGSDSDERARDWTAWLMAQPFGKWLVAVAGIAVAAAGVGIATKGLRGHFEQLLQLDDNTKLWLSPLARYGHFARGAVFVMIGLFLIAAAVHANPSEAKGLGGALRLLQQQPYGWLLLAITAAGFLAFGVFEMVQAAYRRGGGAPPPDPPPPGRGRCSPKRGGPGTRWCRVLFRG